MSWYLDKVLFNFIKLTLRFSMGFWHLIQEYLCWSVLLLPLRVANIFTHAGIAYSCAQRNIFTPKVKHCHTGKIIKISFPANLLKHILLRLQRGSEWFQEHGEYSSFLNLIEKERGSICTFRKRTPCFCCVATIFLYKQLFNPLRCFKTYTFNHVGQSRSMILRTIRRHNHAPTTTLYHLNWILNSRKKVQSTYRNV